LSRHPPSVVAIFGPAFDSTPNTSPNGLPELEQGAVRNELVAEHDDAAAAVSSACIV